MACFSHTRHGSSHSSGSLAKQEDSDRERRGGTGGLGWRLRRVGVRVVLDGGSWGGWGEQGGRYGDGGRLDSCHRANGLDSLDGWVGAERPGESGLRASVEMTKASLMGPGNPIRLYCLCEARAVIQFEENRKASVIDRKVHICNLDHNGQMGKNNNKHKAYRQKERLGLRQRSSPEEKKCSKLLVWWQ